MNRDKRVLATLDLSPCSIEVLKVAVQLALRVDGKLLVGNVINKLEIEILKNLWNIKSLDRWDVETLKKVWKIGPLKNEYHSEREYCINPFSTSCFEVDCVDDLKQERKNMIHDMLRETQADNLTVEVIFSEGNPFEELLKMVENHSIDIVVIGPKGRSNLANTLFGSIAEKMFRRCPAHVVSVRIQKFSNEKIFQRFRKLYNFQSRLFKAQGAQTKGQLPSLPEEPFKDTPS